MLFREVLKGNKIFTIDRNIKNISYGLIPECLESPGWGSIIFTRSTAASVCRRKKIFPPFKITIHVLFLSALFLPPWQPGSCEKFQFNRQHFQHGCFLDNFEEPNISAYIIEYGGDFALAYCKVDLKVNLLRQFFFHVILFWLLEDREKQRRLPFSATKYIFLPNTKSWTNIRVRDGDNSFKAAPHLFR